MFPIKNSKLYTHNQQPDVKSMNLQQLEAQRRAIADTLADKILQACIVNDNVSEVVNSLKNNDILTLQYFNNNVLAEILELADAYNYLKKTITEPLNENKEEIYTLTESEVVENQKPNIAIGLPLSEILESAFKMREMLEEHCRKEREENLKLH